MKTPPQDWYGNKGYTYIKERELGYTLHTMVFEEDKITYQGKLAILREYISHTYNCYRLYATDGYIDLRPQWIEQTYGGVLFY